LDKGGNVSPSKEDPDLFILNEGDKMRLGAMARNFDVNVG
jgi:hypothetical protein